MFYQGKINWKGTKRRAMTMTAQAMLKYHVVAIGGDRIYSGKTVYTEKACHIYYSGKITLKWASQSICRAKDHHLIMPQIKYWYFHVGEPFLATYCSQHILCFMWRFGWNRSEGQVKENCCWKQGRNRKKETHLIVPPSPWFIRFSRTLSVSLFLKDLPSYTAQQGLLAHSKL